jgi:hypothetical protein
MNGIGGRRRRRRRMTGIKKGENIRKGGENGVARIEKTEPKGKEEGDVMIRKG